MRGVLDRQQLQSGIGLALPGCALKWRQLVRNNWSSQANISPWEAFFAQKFPDVQPFLEPSQPNEPQTKTNSPS
jgi:hypothetical protein